VDAVLDVVLCAAAAAAAVLSFGKLLLLNALESVLLEFLVLLADLVLSLLCLATAAGTIFFPFRVSKTVLF
jgi:hypothetical protein